MNRTVIDVANPINWFTDNFDHETFKTNQEGYKDADKKLYPYTPYHPRDSWLKTLRLSTTGETYDEGVARNTYLKKILDSLGPGVNRGSDTPDSMRSSIADFRDTVETDSLRAWNTESAPVSPVPGPSHLHVVDNTALLSPGSGFLAPKSPVTSSTALGLSGTGDYFADSVQHGSVKSKLSSAPPSPAGTLTTPLPQVENPIPNPQMENLNPRAKGKGIDTGIFNQGRRPRFMESKINTLNPYPTQARSLEPITVPTSGSILFNPHLPPVESTQNSPTVNVQGYTCSGNFFNTTIPSN